MVCSFKYSWDKESHLSELHLTYFTRALGTRQKVFSAVVLHVQVCRLEAFKGLTGMYSAGAGGRSPADRFIKTYSQPQTTLITF